MVDQWFFYRKLTILIIITFQIFIPFWGRGFTKNKIFLFLILFYDGETVTQNDSWQSNFASNPRWRQWHGRQPPDRAAHARRYLTRRPALVSLCAADALAGPAVTVTRRVCVMAIFDLSYMCGNHSNSRKNRLRIAKMASKFPTNGFWSEPGTILTLICHHINIRWRLKWRFW